MRSSRVSVAPRREVAQGDMGSGTDACRRAKARAKAIRRRLSLVHVIIRKSGCASASRLKDGLEGRSAMSPKTRCNTLLPVMKASPEPLLVAREHLSVGRPVPRNGHELEALRNRAEDNALCCWERPNRPIRRQVSSRRMKESFREDNFGFVRAGGSPTRKQY